jgi:branched-chain amino acid transport system permease protein
LIPIKPPGRAPRTVDEAQPIRAAPIGDCAAACCGASYEVNGKAGGPSEACAENRETGEGERMEYFAQQVINGLTLGSIYGLIAIGYTMVFGIIGMVNFAHGDVFMLSTFKALIFILILTPLLYGSAFFVVLALIVVLVLGMVLTALWSWAIERVAYRPLRGSFRLAPLISAIGVSIFLMNFVQLVQGPRNKPVPPIIEGGVCLVGESAAGRTCLIEKAGYGVNLAWKQIVIMLVTFALLSAFWYVVQRTSLGRAQRACEQDRKMAGLLGIDVDRTIATTFVIGGALASVAGVMYMLQYGVVNFADGFVPGVKAFTAAVLGGIGSLPGAVLGGLIIGLIEALWSAYFSIDYKDVASFSILAIVLIFLPQGILGQPEVEKV